MGMSLSEGGHLTHGSPVNLSGKYFNFVPYGVNSEGFIDYEKLHDQAMQVKPKLIVAGASAYPRAITSRSSVRSATTAARFLWLIWLTLPVWSLPVITRTR